MKVVGVIPSRMASSRFPGKPLVDIGGKTMIQRVYEQACKSESLDKVFVATDHDEILNEVKRFGGEVKMTSSKHENGTSRCLDLVKQLDADYDVVVNIQGDEPFIAPSDINTLIACFDNKETQIATLAKKIEIEEEINNPTVVKIVFDNQKRSLYFSRAGIPYNNDSLTRNYYKHIGIYAYRRSVLEELVQLPVSTLEMSEKLEQLRWLDNGYNIQVDFTEHESNSVDTPEDLENLKKMFNL